MGYSNILAWQLTIWSIHIAPIVALRCINLSEDIKPPMCVCWLIFSWWHRDWRCSAFSVGLLLLEVVASVVSLTPRIIAVLLFLQGLVVLGFWSGVLLASSSASFTFLNLDRHLHLGFQHVVRSP